jgi:hypothetical protein
MCVPEHARREAFEMTGILLPIGPAGIASTATPGTFCRANLAAC